MNGRIKVWTALAALAWAGSIGAHHSESMFEGSPVWVKGRVVDFARTNPHAIVTLEETTAEGEVRRWAVEGPSVWQFARRGIEPDSVRAGDVVEFCGFPMKEEFSSPPPGAPPFVHGQVVVLPDGKMKMWGSYGRITNCVRPDDSGQAWADFLSSSVLARAAWCRRFSSSIPTREDTKALIAEINGLMAQSCQA